MFASDRPTWRNPRVFAILLLVFLSGAICGGLTMHWMHQNREVPVLSYERLRSDLKLRPEQCQRLKQILADMARYHQDLQAQLEDWQATGKNDIIKILDPDQRARFEQIAAQK